MQILKHEWHKEQEEDKEKVRWTGGRGWAGLCLCRPITEVCNLHMFDSDEWGTINATSIGINILWRQFLVGTDYKRYD